MDKKKETNEFKEAVEWLLKMAKSSNAGKANKKSELSDGWIVDLSVRKKGCIPYDEMPDFKQIERLMKKWDAMTAEEKKAYENKQEYLEKSYKIKDE